MIWIYDGHMITGEGCGTNFLTAVLRLRENPEKTSTRKVTRPGIEPVTASLEVTMLPLDHSGGPYRSWLCKAQSGLSYVLYCIFEVLGRVNI